MTAPVLEQDITSRNGDKLWIRAEVHDWTGSATVYITDKAAPTLYGCETTEEVLQKAKEKALQVQLMRHNMRGLLRLEDGVMRKYVAELLPSPKAFSISSKAMRETRGIAPINSGVAQAAPVDRIVSDAMQGLCLLADASDGSNGAKEQVPCFAAYILVTGIETTQMHPLIEGVTDMEKQEYMVSSKNAKCVLSGDTDVRIDLQCYCHWNDSLDYRLNKESAIVRVSGVTAQQTTLVASVEHIDKVSKAEFESVRQAMKIEWQTALVHTSSGTMDQYQSLEKRLAFKNPVRKVRRVSSDPRTRARYVRA